MKIEKALAHLLGEYNKCKDDQTIHKPVSYALYRTWGWCDENEKPRAENGRKKMDEEYENESR